MVVRGAAEGDGGVADEEDVVVPRGIRRVGEQPELRCEAAFREQHPQQVHAGAARRVEEDRADPPERLPVREEDAGDRTARGDGRAVEHVEAVVEQHLRDAHERGVQPACMQFDRQPGRREEDASVLDPRGERDGVEIRHGADAERGRWHAVEAGAVRRSAQTFAPRAPYLLLVLSDGAPAR